MATPSLPNIADNPALLAQFKAAVKAKDFAGAATVIELNGLSIRSDQCSKAFIEFVSARTGPGFMKTDVAPHYRNAVTPPWNEPDGPQFWPSNEPRLAERCPHWTTLGEAAQYRIRHWTMMGEPVRALQEIRAAGASIHVDEPGEFQALVKATHQFDANTIEREGRSIAFRPRTQ